MRYPNVLRGKEKTQWPTKIILLFYIKVWNEWREKNPGVIPDLSDADLGGATLNNTDVSNIKYLDRKLEHGFLTWLYPHSIMRGKYQGIRVASCYGNAIFKRDAEDQDFLYQCQ